MTRNIPANFYDVTINSFEVIEGGRNPPPPPQVFSASKKPSPIRVKVIKKRFRVGLFAPPGIGLKDPIGLFLAWEQI